MFEQLPTFQKLLRQLQQLPYLASKNIYKVAFYFLNSDRKKVEQFCQVLLDVKDRIGRCHHCFNLTEGESLCSICRDEKRNKKIICVVENWYDLFAIEKAGGYDGVYHVLGGVLSPLEGIGENDLNLYSLFKRISNLDIEELILATNATPEGEATASFIYSKLEHLRDRFKITRLASGVPIGSSLEYMDKVTIYKAISGRQPF